MTAAELTSFNAPITGDNEPPAPSGIPAIITAIGTAVGAVLHHPNYPSLPPGVTAVPRPAQPLQQAGLGGGGLMMFLILGAILFMLVSKKKG